MREITRIHIAKVAYDIEIDAKKDIESYINALERYANDSGILEDIEIRITELLAENGVVAGGVIGEKDVEFVRSRLGEPSDFAGDTAMQLDDDSEAISNQKHIYRDVENAIAGGVLSGIAKYLAVDALWVRLAFIVVLIASFGTGIVLYAILWLIIPPAETVADKLRMSGQPVTLASIKELVKNDERTGQTTQVARRLLSSIGGLLMVLMAIAGLIAIIVVVFGVQLGFGPGEMVPVTDRWVLDTWWFRAVMGLFIMSGLLFSALCFILANAVFRRVWTRRTGVAVVAIIAAGLVTFAGGIGAGTYGIASERVRIEKLHQNTSGSVPMGLKDITSFTFVDTGFEGAVPVQYIVSDTPRYELDAFPGVEPRFEISDDGKSAKVKLVNTDEFTDRGLRFPFGSLGYGMTILRVYGPALSGVEVESNGSPVSYSNDSGQDKLTVNSQGGSGFSLAGKYGTVSVIGGKFGTISLEDAAITELHVEGGGTIVAGVVRSLSIDQPDVCATGDFNGVDYSVRVQGVSGGKIIYNGVEQPAKTVEGECGEVVVGD